MKMFMGAPTGRVNAGSMCMRAEFWGPHEVGGAEPGAERR